MYLHYCVDKGVLFQVTQPELALKMIDHAMPHHKSRSVTR
jgi:hypothetical protein